VDAGQLNQPGTTIGQDIELDIGQICHNRPPYLWLPGETTVTTIVIYVEKISFGQSIVCLTPPGVEVRIAILI
jgi:hypothetical protein